MPDASHPYTAPQHVPLEPAGNRVIEDDPTHPILVGYAFWVLGMFGAHRFYFGKPITGLIWLMTGGLLFVGWIVDLFLIPAMADEANYRYRQGPYDYTLAWVLLTFLGIFGVHRFYVGKFLSGLIYLLSAGLFGIGIIYDFATLNEQVAEANSPHKF